jgi:uncharacterized SAM-binding protein YcdF (DUF218 family)
METSFWIMSKLFWKLLAPAKVVLILLFLGAILLWTRKQALGRWLVSIAVLMLMVGTLLPVSGFLMGPLEERFSPPSELPKSIVGIIVLGGPEKAGVTATRGQPSLSEGGERLITFIGLARQYPEARLIFAGGSGSLSSQEYKSNDTARLLFELLGLNPERVLFDANARNTYENAVNSFELIGRKPEGDWVLITSAYHMPRSVGIFRKIGWPVIPYPVDYQTTGQWKFDWKIASLEKYLEFSQGVKEWTGLLVYWMTDKTSEFFPKPASR